MSKTAKAIIATLFVLVIVSLSMNFYLLWQWVNFQQRVEQSVQLTQLSLTQAVSDLNDIKETSIEITVPIQQNVPLRTDIPFNQIITVPIDTQFPFQHEIKTQITLEMPELGLKAPLDVIVPINTMVPIQFETDVPFNSVIPVQTTIPLQLDVPITIKVSDTELADYIDRLRFLLASVNGAVAGLEE